MDQDKQIAKLWNAIQDFQKKESESEDTTESLREINRLMIEAADSQVVSEEVFQ